MTNTFFDTTKGDIVINAAWLAALLAATGNTALATGTLTVTGDVIFSGGSVADTVGTGITAGTTHSLAGATALTHTINYISICANSADAVALPAATAAMVGKKVTIFNDADHAAAVWPQAADAIDGGTTGAAVTLTNAKRCTYYYKAVNAITSAQLGGVTG